MIRIRLSILPVCLLFIPWFLLIANVICYHITETPSGYDPDLEELQELSSAIKDYARKYGGFPPDFSSGDPKSEIDGHLRNIFPARSPDLDVPSLVNELGPHNALYFWLQGFSSDPIQPITGSLRQKPWFEFSQRRLTLKDEYMSRSSRTPFIYFQSRTFEKAFFSGSPTWGKAWPYLKTPAIPNQRKEFIETDGFQIIAAGRDGVFGQQQIAANQAFVFKHHKDNIANFSTTPLGYQQIADLREQRWITCALNVFVAIICLLLYPLACQLQSRINGTSVLKRIVARQIGRSPTSDSWQETLADERAKRRESAVMRFSGNRSSRL